MQGAGDEAPLQQHGRNEAERIEMTKTGGMKILLQRVSCLSFASAGVLKVGSKKLAAPKLVSEGVRLNRAHRRLRQRLCPRQGQVQGGKPQVFFRYQNTVAGMEDQVIESAGEELRV